jgi:hypothetical protein
MENRNKWYTITLRIIGDALTPDDISKRLDLKPTSFGLKGKPVGNKEGRAVYEHNLWLLHLTQDDSIPFEEQFPNILDLLEKRHDSLGGILKMSGMEGEFFLGYASKNGQGGSYFSVSLMKRITNLGLNIQFDLYP